MRSTSRLVVGITAAAVLAGQATAASAAPAPPATGEGTVRVTVTTPDGVPANVGLDGKTQHIAGKAPDGTSGSAVLTMPSGAYHVELPSVIFDGVRYLGRSSRPEVVVRPGETSSLQVTYAAEEGARALHATAVGQTSVSLAWEAPAGSRFVLRRTTGGVPAAQLSDGVGVPVDGTSAVDAGLELGTEYTYSLFTQNKSRWHGPLVVEVGTAPEAGSTDAAFVAAPTTLIAEAADLVSATPTGTGVRVVLAQGVPTPLLGSAVVLPISDELEGGFLGVVSSVSPDGRTLGLVAGSLSDAFDFYEIAVDEFSVGFEGEAVQPAAAPVAEISAHDPAAARVASPQAAPAQADQAATAQAAKVAPGCGDVSGEQKITFDPSMSLGGHFTSKLDKYNFMGQDVPTGASLDMAVTAKVTGAAAVQTSGSYECSLGLPKLFKTLTYYPVPISVALSPIAQFTIGGGLEVSNVGVTATGGVQVAGHMSLQNGASFSGNALLDAQPLTPDVKVNGSVGVKVGGEIVVGPGAGTANAGVIAGVNGELAPLDAKFEPYFEHKDSRFNACTVTEAAFTRSLSLVAKAWLDKWTWSEKITVPALEGKTPYFGSPWYLPKDCNNLPTTEAPESLLGPGVVKVDDSLVGAPGQAGFVDGFAPGASTWVLSTGHIADAVGSPGQVASRNLGGAGDAGLTALAGRPTYDAASYAVTVVPAASTLNVRYVFASEEYPEWVGSAYNDVMAVRINGENCARVPGTSQAVAINTINHYTNTAYYVDNTSGAAGYSTSMDGLTVPLTCSVPVTPGVPVTVEIAVADTSDHILDSAVALVDGGIWSN